VLSSLSGEETQRTVSGSFELFVILNLPNQCLTESSKLPDTVLWVSSPERELSTIEVE